MRGLTTPTLRTLPPSARPELDPAEVELGVVHLGIGAFHRAHQAVHTEDAMVVANDPRWGICGVTQRSPRVRDLLRPQDGLYTLTTKDGRDTRHRVVSSVREVLDGASEGARVQRRLGDPAVPVVLLTVTEKAYHLHPATQRLDTDDPEIRADVGGRPPRTVIGRLVDGLRHRRDRDAGPITVISCDNLPGNGALLRAAVHTYCTMLPGGDELASWIGANATFPSTMVDRIVPGATDEDRRRVAADLGVRDEATVVAEPFTQWVIEDDIRTPHPAWDEAGARFVPDVRPYELTKLRTLNACHSLLAHLGALSDIDTIAGTVAVDEFAAAAHRLATTEVGPTLPPIAGTPHEEYVATVLRRFANPALPHTTRQVATDGSRKVGPRLLGTVTDALAQGREPEMATLAVAAWLRHLLVQRSDSGTGLRVDDPAEAAVHEATRHAIGPAVVPLALAAAGMPRELLDDDRFVGRVRHWYAEMDRFGVLPTVRAAVR